MERPVERCEHGVWLADLCYQCDAMPQLPAARPDNQGVLVSNPAWVRYMRAVDVWEEPLVKAEDLNECICGGCP